VVFRIVTPMFNAGALVAENVAMLRRQTHRDFHCVLVDDCSTDDSVAIARRAVAGDSRFEILCNDVKRYAIGNAVTALERMRPADDDVVVLVDGDDRLFAEDVLERIAGVYAQGNCWLTYGSYTSAADGAADSRCQAYPPTVVRSNSFRRERWYASHLKTFSARLWRHIDAATLRTDEAELRSVTRRKLLTGHPRIAWQMRQVGIADLLDPSGRWFRRCYDKAIMLPLLELSGQHAVFVPEVVYRYNSTGSSGRRSGEARKGQFAQRAIRAILGARQPLTPLRPPVSNAPSPLNPPDLASGSRIWPSSR
jgi:glycosyltransferase involved in cell wall biosynthesis